jgi:hypothetical protein
LRQHYVGGIVPDRSIFCIAEEQVGDSFSNITNATIVNRSTLTSALNAVRATPENTESASALESVAKLIEQSGNPEAVELFNALTEQLQSPRPQRALLRSTWDGIKKALPAVTSIAGAVQAIAKLVG